MVTNISMYFNLRKTFQMRTQEMEIWLKLKLSLNYFLIISKFETFLSRWLLIPVCILIISFQITCYKPWRWSVTLSIHFECYKYIAHPNSEVSKITFNGTTIFEHLTNPMNSSAWTLHLSPTALKSITVDRVEMWLWKKYDICLNEMGCEHGKLLFNKMVITSLKIPPLAVL